MAKPGSSSCLQGLSSFLPKCFALCTNQDNTNWELIVPGIPVALLTRNLFLPHGKNFVNGQHPMKSLWDPRVFSLYSSALFLGLKVLSGLLLVGIMHLEKAHLLLIHFISEEVHITSTYTPLVRTSHIIGPRCRAW